MDSKEYFFQIQGAQSFIASAKKHWIVSYLDSHPSTRHYDVTSFIDTWKMEATKWSEFEAFDFDGYCKFMPKVLAIAETQMAAAALVCMWELLTIKR